MRLSRFKEEWREVANRWGLRVEIPFTVALSKAQVTVPILLRDFGAIHGMLLVTDFNVIAAHIDELRSFGYGFSCLSEPSGGVHPEGEQALMETLLDWGWSGRARAPSWYRGSTG